MARKRKKNLIKKLDAALPVALFLVFALIGYLLFMSPQKSADRPKPPVAPPHSAAPAPKPPAPEKTVTPPSTRPEPLFPPPVADKPEKPEYRARVAILIDDLGSDIGSLKEVLGVDAPLSIAVLPELAYSRDSAAMAAAAGRDVLLHLPMQPKGDSMKGLGPGALYKGMDKELLTGTVEGDLLTVPGVVGVNNHMGSYLTEDREAMSAVMEVLSRRGLFFIDSRTSGGSVAFDSAREHGVPAASRNVFLDDSQDPVEIKRQFDRMVKLSLKNGKAIAIGHPHPATLKVLTDELPGLKEKGIEVVSVSALVR